MRASLLGLLLLFCINSIACGADEPVRRTAILGAMSLELEILQKALIDPKTQVIENFKFVSGTLNGRPVVVAKTGVGKVNAAIVSTLLIEHYKPSEVFFTGIAGGLNPEMLPGDVVIATRTATHDYGDLTPAGMQREGTRNPITGKRNPLYYPADPRLIEIAEKSAMRVKLEPIKLETGERQPALRKGTVVTGDVFVAASDKKAELIKALQADAVEMEGAAVAQVCFQQNVPCLVIRSLSDVADGNAVADAKTFGAVAAKNSAMLVIEILGQLAAAPVVK